MKKTVYIAAIGAVIVVLIIIAVVLVVVLTQNSAGSELPPTCDSKIYCQGDLLHYAQMLSNDMDSKDFVDLVMLHDEDEILKRFEILMEATDSNPKTDDMHKFINENFVNASDLIEWVPTDFQEHPQFLDKIGDQEVKAFTKGVIARWPVLGRKVNEEVNKNPSRYSLRYIPEGFIIPGGRFREYYYWDSYWIIDGLLISEMADTARGMIENFLYTIKNVGHIPNGGRIYYIRRSQPPLLSMMMRRYYEHTLDVDWLRKNIEILETELEFWIQNRLIEITIGNKTYYGGRYNAASAGPRPESYKEDVTTASITEDAEHQQEIYTQLKSAAESGWDFSSRWIFSENEQRNEQIVFTNITRVLPVDLNSFLYGAFKDAANFYEILQDEMKKSYWTEKADEIYKTINEILWNADDGIWYDYDYLGNQQRRYFAASNLSPLWTKAYDQNKKEQLIDDVIAYLQRENIMNYMGGIPATNAHTGEQWDFPNVWPCLQSIVVEGLEESDTEKGKYWARVFADRFVNATMIRFNIDGNLYEKYDAVEPGNYGGGGEYVIQTGFGWTNGVILRMIEKYYTDIITENSQYTDEGHPDFVTTQ